MGSSLPAAPGRLLRFPYKLVISYCSATQMTHNIETVADINLGNIATQIPQGRYYFRRHVVRYQKILKSLPEKRPLTILDIGVGYGFLAAAMKKAGHRVFALDFFYGKVAEEVCRHWEIPLLMLNIEAHELPFKDESFDVVVLGEVIEHFTADPVGSLEKARRVLKQDGILIVTTPNSLSAVNRIKRLFGQGNRLTYHRPVMVSGNPYRYGHHRLFCMEELQELLEKAGYQVCDRQFIFPGKVSPGGVSGLFGAVVVRFICLLLPKLKNIILVIAKPL